MDWRPKLPNGGALHERLAMALRRDMENGTLKPGDRLPPQRTLADHLHISVGTVTKAFQDAERQGLVSGQVGRGTFVTSVAKAAVANAPEPTMIDLSVNVVPLAAAAARLAETLRKLQRGHALADLLAYAPPAGAEAQRKSAASWLARTAHFPGADGSRLILTNGGQHAMWLAFAAVCAPGDTILCEAATYYGMKALAETAQYTLHGVAMDAEGMRPDALDSAIAQTGARTLYLMPTVQVPTGRTMTMARRRDIIKIARRHELRIVEDDHYAAFAPDQAGATVPLAQLAPDLCLYLSSVSKSLSPGLRTGFLIMPSAGLFDRAVRILRSTLYAAGSFGPMVTAQWIDDGSAFDITATMLHAMRTRWKRATASLRPLGITTAPFSPHIWLPLSELDMERAAGRAQRAGVSVTPPELPLLDSKLISGIRICIGAPRTEAELALGLERLGRALSRTPEAASSAEGR
jgi:DNA-binding transcriptional MocR family regulator